MKLLNSTLCLLLSIQGFSQTSTTLQQNNVSAFLSTSGHFFNDNATNSAGYELPNGSGIDIIFSNTFWLGGPGGKPRVQVSCSKLCW